MSQSSGLLNDDEIRTWLNEHLDTNLDRDALTKPTREILIQIYSKFLDGTGLRWRTPKNDEFIDNLLEPDIIRMMNKLIEPYEPPYKFLWADLISPNRKRTNLFLNLAIYIRAQSEEYLTPIASYNEQKKQHDEEVEKLKSLIESHRQVYEELAMQAAGLESGQEMAQEIEDLRKKLANMETEGEELKEEGKQIKEEVMNTRERDSRNKQQLKIHEEQIQSNLVMKKTSDDAKLKQIDIKKLQESIQNLDIENEKAMLDMLNNHKKSMDFRYSKHKALLMELKKEIDDISDPEWYEQQRLNKLKIVDQEIAELDNEIRALDEKDVKEIAGIKLCYETLDKFLQKARDEASKMDSIVMKKLKPFLPKLDVTNTVLPQETIENAANRTYTKKT